MVLWLYGSPEALYLKNHANLPFFLASNSGFHKKNIIAHKMAMILYMFHSRLAFNVFIKSSAFASVSSLPTSMSLRSGFTMPSMTVSLQADR